MNLNLFNHEALNNLNNPLPLQKNNLADLVTEKIRRAIIVGKLAAGERLVETAIADQWGISRVPIREALKLLEAEGIITKNKVRGYEVWAPTIRDVDEIVSLRKALESIAYETTISYLQSSDYEFLEQLMNGCQEDFDKKAFDIVIFDDRQFHEYLVEKSGQQRIPILWRQIMAQWEVLLYRGSHLDLPYDSLQFINIHKDILTALHTGNLEKAKNLLSKHCEFSRSEFKRTISFPL